MSPRDAYLLYMALRYNDVCHTDESILISDPEDSTTKRLPTIEYILDQPLLMIIHQTLFLIPEKCPMSMDPYNPHGDVGFS